MPDLSDRVILLRPLHTEDAIRHLAGEDDEIVRWLSGGRSTLATVQSYILRCEESWRINGPLRAFGVFDCGTNRLIGSIEANLAYPLEPGQVNVSYGVFRGWRGRGVALRALQLMSTYLRTATDMRQMILRVASENAASLRVAEKAGGKRLGVFNEPEGRMVHFAVDLSSDLVPTLRGIPLA
jgi:RimJ/RimL family protein N-acetyltransferase